MATLTGQKIKDSFKDLLQVSNGNSGVDTTLRAITDGEGTASSIMISTTSFLFDGSGTFDIDGAKLILDADGDTSITADSDDRIDIEVAGTDAVLIGHDATNSAAFFDIDPAAFTAQANTNIARLTVSNTNAVTVPAGTTAVAAGLRVEEPNLTATGTVTAAASLYVEAAPTEGSDNYAMWVDAGAAKFDGTVDIDGVLAVASDIAHIGDTNNTIGFTTDTQTFTTGGSSRLDITDSGVRLGAANARVTTVLDEDNMVSDSATALSTQQAIKAYVDTQLATISSPTAGTTLAQSPYATNATVTQAHGLGAEPDYYEIYLECTTADLNYSIGDRIVLASGAEGASTEPAFVILGDATNTTLITNSGQVPRIINKTTRGGASITAASWDLEITPYTL